MKKYRPDPLVLAVDGFLRLAGGWLVRLWRLLNPVRPPRGALVLGTAHPLQRNGERSPFWLSGEQRSRHLYVLGSSGSGKTKALESWLRQDLEAGRGCAVLDLHGDLVQSLLAFVALSAKARNRRIYLLDPSVRETVPGFNPLEVPPGVEPFGLVMELIGVFKKIWAEFWGPRMEEILRNGLLTLAEHRLTLLELAPLLTDRDFRLRLVGKLHNPGVKEFWLARFERLSRAAQAAYVEAVLNKAGAFTSDPYLRAMLGQGQGTLDLRRIMDRGDVLLVNLSKGVLKENALLLGALLLTKLQLAALSRADQPADRRRRFHVFVDEFQNFATETFGEILAEARKYGLSLILAHQYLDQLPSRLRAAIFGNVLTQIAFRVSLKDARAMSAEQPAAYREASEQVLTSLPSRQAIVRRKSDPAHYAPWVLEIPVLTVTTATKEGLAELQARALSRAKPLAAVEQEIQERWQHLGLRQRAEEVSRPRQPVAARPSRDLAEVE